MLKKTICLVLTVLWVLAATACTADNASSTVGQALGKQVQSASKRLGDNTGLQWLQIPAPSLQNNLIGESTEQSIGICLPPGYYEENTEYPVLYYLSGYTEDYRVRTKTFYTTMQRLYQQNSIEKMMVVVVNGYNRFGGCWYVNSPVSGNWEDYVVQDVVPYIDAHYRTVPKKEARCLTGHSMGGAGVLSISMRQVGHFSHIYAMSPAVLAPDGFESFGVDFTIIELVQSDYAHLDIDEAAQLYANGISDIPTPFYWTLAYASAFAFEPDMGPPYLLLPEEDGALDAYLGGAGDWENKIAEYADALMQLDSLVIDYGTGDENSWLPPGCKYLEEQLLANDIPHEMTAYEGGHNSHIDERIEAYVIPLFSEKL